MHSLEVLVQRNIEATARELAHVWADCDGQPTPAQAARAGQCIADTILGIWPQDRNRSQAERDARDAIFWRRYRAARWEEA